MSKQRFKTVSTSALTSKKLARLDATQERLFWRIHYASDSYGTMSGDPWDVLQAAVPGVKGFDLDIVAATVEALVGAKLLERWQEADEAWWIHVIDHDRHQSAYYRSKRGARHTPIPPSLRKGNHNGEQGTARESSASRAEVSPTGHPRYPLGIGVEGGAGIDVGAAPPPTATKPSAHASAHEAAGGNPVVAKDLPPNQRSPEARIRQAQRDLESHASSVILAMIARRNASSDNMLTATEEFDRYWRPACEVLAEHGKHRLREAMNAAGAANATSIKYVATVAGRIRDEAAAAPSNPDVGTGDWDHLTPKAS